MNEKVDLVLGASIGTHTGRGRGKVGAIVTDGRGKLYGLTAAHILACEEDKRIYTDLSLEPVGQRIDLPNADGFEYDGNTTDHFFATIGCFEIFQDSVSAGNSISNAQVIEAADPYEVIGQNVIKVAESALSYPGRVISFGKSLKFVNPYTGYTRSLCGALELDFFNVIPQVVLGPGEVGSLVIDPNDRAVGMLIGQSGGKCFAAPIAPFLAMHGFRFFAPDHSVLKVSEHLDLGAFLAAELRETRAGIQGMKQDIISEGDGSFSAKRDVPLHLIELLEGAQ